MPTNRHKRVRKIRKTTLSDAMCYFLETGDHLVRDRFPDTPCRESTQIFRYGNPSYREKLALVWNQHKEEVLRNWKLKKRRGLPWAAKEFN